MNMEELIKKAASYIVTATKEDHVFWCDVISDTNRAWYHCQPYYCCGNTYVEVMDLLEDFRDNEELSDDIFEELTEDSNVEEIVILARDMKNNIAA